ncbi:poly polymerase [Fusarium napiforme]|uniref:Poly polymerase n=1 Tax=Fusarium napiforme TaxID=42672 RepID=A0A8H5IY41_9HYPO|nr:poly polymerase [Fusarium napiforme]
MHDEPRPAQNEYPVWYFVYGDLADPSVLVELLDDNLRFYTAVIMGGGYIENFTPANNVEDLMFPTSIALQVETQEQEDMLRAYQGDAYEVVRCPIYVMRYAEMWGYGEEVPGLTFRLIKKATD